MSKTSRYLFFLFQLLVSLGFIYLLLRKSDLAQIRTHLAAASLLWLASSLITKACGFSFMAIRLSCLAGSAGSLSAAESFRAQSIAFVGNNVLPFRLGEVLKVGYMASRSLGSFTSCLGVATVERLLDAVFLVLFIGAAVLFFSESIPTGGTLFLFSGIACSAFVFLFLAARYPDRCAGLVGASARVLGPGISQLLREQSANFVRGLAALASPRLITVIALTAGYWLCSALSVYIWIRAFGIELPWHASLVVLVFVSLSTVIPAAPGFIGTYHYFAALALGLFGVSSELAASFAIVGHAVAIIPFTIILAPLVARDIVTLHREGIPRLARATQQTASSVRGSDSFCDRAVDTGRLS